MAVAKKASRQAAKKAPPARGAKARKPHSNPDKDHESGTVRVTIEVGPLQRIKRKRGKAKKPAANKEVKAFLTWVLEQL